MFGADKEAHTDTFFKAVVAKVGPKIDRRHHQGVPTLEKEKLWHRQALGRQGKASLAGAAPSSCFSLWVPGVDR